MADVHADAERTGGINPDFEGRSYPPGPTYQVGREKLRDFAHAVGARDPIHTDLAAARAAGYPDLVATPTFPIVIAQRSALQAYYDPDANIDFARVVHGEERFDYHRPIVAGDELIPQLFIEKVRQAGPNSLMITRVELTSTTGEPVCTAYSTLFMRGV